VHQLFSSQTLHIKNLFEEGRPTKVLQQKQA